MSESIKEVLHSFSPPLADKEYKLYKEKFTSARELLAEGREVPVQWISAMLRELPIIEALVKEYKRSGKLIPFEEAYRICKSGAAE